MTTQPLECSECHWAGTLNNGEHCPNCNAFHTMGQNLHTRLGDLVDTCGWEDVLMALAKIAHDEAEDRCGRPGQRFLETIGDGLENLLEAAQYPICADDPPVLTNLGVTDQSPTAS